MKLLSVVIPVYNEERVLDELYRQLSVALVPAAGAGEFEVVFVDDGSSDRSPALLEAMHTKDSRVKVVRLQRNYGQLYAFLVGLTFAKGDVVVTMDADLQNDPADIPALLRRLDEGFDLVSGWRYNRNDGLARRVLSRMANALIAARTGVRLHDYGCALTAARAGLIAELLTRQAGGRFIKPVLATLARRPTEIRVRHHRRGSGASKYGLLKILRLGFDFLLHFDPHSTGEPLSCRVERLIGIP